MKQRFTKRTRLVSALLTLAMVFTFLPFSAFAAEGVTDDSTIELSEQNFPDKAFREYIKTKFDKKPDNRLIPAERKAVKKIDVSGGYNGQKITNLKGIEFFPNLEELYCDNNQLTSLDVSQNKALKYLNCSENQLTSLDVSENIALQKLSCYRNQLTSLDVSQNTQLKELRCYGNQLTSLDVSKNPALVWLSCTRNQLTSLDLSPTVVSTLYAAGNQIDINVEETSRTFDLSTLPGKFDVTKATNWSGGAVSGSTLTVDKNATQVTYTYDGGKGLSRDFTLNVKVVPDGTVTPPEPPVTPPEPPVTPPSGGGDGGGAVVIVAAAGAVAAGVVGYGVYNYVSGQKLQALLPEGVAAPENRAQTALLLWNTAGRPEPAEAPAFADVADPDTAKAAQWCVEQGLMKRHLNGKFAPGSSIPAYQVLNAYRKLAG